MNKLFLSKGRLVRWYYRMGRYTLGLLVVGGFVILNSISQPCAAAPISNIVTNPGFEDGQIVWNFTTSGSAVNTVATDAYYSGVKSNKMTVNDTLSQAETVQSIFNLPVNTTFNLTYYLKTSLQIGGPGATVKIEQYDSNNNFLGSGGYTPTWAVGTTGWTKYNATFTTYANTNKVVIYPILSLTIGTVWFDSISITQPFKVYFYGTCPITDTASVDRFLASNFDGMMISGGSTSEQRQWIDQLYAAGQEPLYRFWYSSWGIRNWLDLYYDTTKWNNFKAYIDQIYGTDLGNYQKIRRTQILEENMLDPVAADSQGWSENDNDPDETPVRREEGSNANRIGANPEFEDGAVQWTFYAPSGTSNTVVTTDYHTGAKSNKITINNANKTAYTKKTLTNLDTNSKYELSYSLKTGLGTGTGAWVELKQYDSGGTFLGDGGFTETYVTGTTGWTRYHEAFTTYANMATVEVYLKVQQTAGTAWYDTTSLYKIYTPLKLEGPGPNEGMPEVLAYENTYFTETGNYMRDGDWNTWCSNRFVDAYSKIANYIKTTYVPDVDVYVNWGSTQYIDISRFTDVTGTTESVEIENPYIIGRHFHTVKPKWTNYYQVFVNYDRPSGESSAEQVRAFFAEAYASGAHGITIFDTDPINWNFAYQQNDAMWALENELAGIYSGRPVLHYNSKVLVAADSENNNVLSEFQKTLKEYDYIRLVDIGQLNFDLTPYTTLVIFNPDGSGNEAFTSSVVTKINNFINGGGNVVFYGVVVDTFDNGLGWVFENDFKNNASIGTDPTPPRVWNSVPGNPLNLSGSWQFNSPYWTFTIINSNTAKQILDVDSTNAGTYWKSGASGKVVAIGDNSWISSERDNRNKLIVDVLATITTNAEKSHFIISDSTVDARIDKDSVIVFSSTLYYPHNSPDSIAKKGSVVEFTNENYLDNTVGDFVISDTGTKTADIPLAHNYIYKSSSANVVSHENVSGQILEILTNPLSFATTYYLDQIPVEVFASSGTVDAKNVTSYDSSMIKFEINGGNSSTVKVRNGVFSILPNTKYRVCWKNLGTSSIVDDVIISNADSILQFNVNSGNFEITVWQEWDEMTDMTNFPHLEESWLEYGDTAARSLANGILTISTTSIQECYYREHLTGTYWYNNVSNATGWTLEARVKVTAADSTRGLGISFGDGTYLEELFLFPDQVKFGINTSLNFPFILNDRYHNIRITGKGADFMVYVDGGLLADGTGLFSTNPNTSKTLMFGDFSTGLGINGTALWDYFYICTHGAFIPEGWGERTDMINFPHLEESWLEFGDTAARSLANGILTISTTGSQECYYREHTAGRYWYDNVSNTTGWTLEARVKVTASDSTRGQGISFGDGTYLEEMYLFTDRITFSVNTSLNFLITLNDTYHNIRITGKGADFKVYVDGVLKADGTGLFSTNPNTSKTLMFGDFSTGLGINGTALWDYFYISTAGATVP